MSEKRIYVVVAQTVTTMTRGDVQQPLGRQIAQACHAVSKMRLLQQKSHPKLDPTEAITTIVLCARDSKELYHVWNLLKTEEIPFEWFQDDNAVVYGEELVHTAISTYPVEPEAVDGILDYLPLWGSDRHLTLVPKVG